MAYNTKRDAVYGLEGVLNLIGNPKIAKRAPTTKDKAPNGKLWVDIVNHASYVCCGTASNSTYWSVTALTDPGAVNVAGLLTAAVGLVVTAGGITSGGNVDVTGTILASTSIGAGTSLAAGTTITAGTTVTAGTGITATTGNITATNGEFISTVATKGLRLGAAGPTITSGAGAPAAVVAKGSVYLRTDGASADEVLYVATDAAGTWVPLIST